jgi:Rod binding domain-containing protein
MTMNIGALQSGFRPGELSLEQVSTSSVISEQEKVAELARQFEGVMVRQMLREARQPMLESAPEGGSSDTRAYDDMVTDRMAEAITRGGGFGVASSLQAQLLRQIPHPGGRADSAPDAPQK